MNKIRIRIDGEQSRAKILAAAVRLASVDGIDRLSLARLAAATGMSKSGVFGLFGSKQRLQLATIDAARAIFIAEVIEPALESRRGREQLLALCEGFLDYIARRRWPEGCFFASVAAEVGAGDGPLRDRVAAGQKEWVGLLCLQRSPCDRGWTARLDLRSGSDRPRAQHHAHRRRHRIPAAPRRRAARARSPDRSRTPVLTLGIHRVSYRHREPRKRRPGYRSWLPCGLSDHGLMSQGRNRWEAHTHACGSAGWVAWRCSAWDRWSRRLANQTGLLPGSGHFLLLRHGGRRPGRHRVQIQHRWQQHHREIDPTRSSSPRNGDELPFGVLRQHRDFSRRLRRDLQPAGPVRRR